MARAPGTLKKVQVEAEVKGELPTVLPLNLSLNLNLPHTSHAHLLRLRVARAQGISHIAHLFAPSSAEAQPARRHGTADEELKILRSRLRS